MPTAEKSNLKALLILVSIVLVISGGYFICVDASKLPKSDENTFRLLPGQKATVENQTFRVIEIESQFPIAARMGDCEQRWTVELRCDTAPADIQIVDRRIPVTNSPPVNLVTVKERER